MNYGQHGMAFITARGVVTPNASSIINMYLSDNLSPVRYQAITWLMLVYQQLQSNEQISVQFESNDHNFR